MTATGSQHTCVQHPVEHLHPKHLHHLCLRWLLPSYNDDDDDDIDDLADDHHLGNEDDHNNDYSSKVEGSPVRCANLSTKK